MKMATAASARARALAAVALALALALAAAAAPQPPAQPGRREYAAAARWLLCASGHGVVATDGAVSNAGLLNATSGAAGIPFANVVSFADGVVRHGRVVNCTGEPYFYLTGLDVTGKDLLQNPWASLSMSMADLRYTDRPICALVNPETPTCWRLTLVGRMVPIADDAERKLALRSLFSRHPDMEFWPSDHNFVAFKMEVSKVFLLDFFGGPPSISVEEYFAADLDEGLAEALAPQ